MAERPRGRGRIGNRGRGRGGPRPDRTNDGYRDVPWRILLGYKRLQELKEKEANEIILTLAKRKNAFKEGLEEPQHDDEMVALFLRCISKACECGSLRQTMIELFVIFEDSSFFKSSLPSYMYEVQSETGNFTQMKYQQPLRDILVIVKEFRLRMPQSIFQVIGLNTILGTTFQTLRGNSSPVLDDDMWDSYVEYKESQEEAFNHRAAKQEESKREVDNEDDPPNDFRELKVFPVFLSDKSKLWSKMVDHARQHNFIGEGLYLYCQNHPNDDGMRAIAPLDLKKAPEGGCMKACEYRLPCGHTCARDCHTYDKDHEEYECNKPCPKYICERKHRCSRRCNQECGRCHKLVPKVLPKCGHTEDIPCSLDPTNWRCAARCRDTLPCGHPCRNLCGEAHTEFCRTRIMKRLDCGHSAQIYCAEQATTVCTEHCSQELECGHLCRGTCGKCFQGRLHVFCTKQCQRPLVCEHLCQDCCSSSCPSCKRQCENRCKHGYCGKKCGSLCVPCSEMCEWRCRHYRCIKVCSEPCERPRCNEPCREKMDCGHPCIGLCGEPYADFVTKIL